MKKSVIVVMVIILILFGIFMVLHNKIKNNFKIDFCTDNKKINVGEEIILQIKTNKQIVATNFELIYDNESFELIGSETENFMVAKKNDKIACIYADITGKGINIFKLKLKAMKETKAEFKIINSKFREVNKEESYVQDEIEGINKKIKIQVIK